ADPSTPGGPRPPLSGPGWSARMARAWRIVAPPRANCDDPPRDGWRGGQGTSEMGGARSGDVNTFSGSAARWFWFFLGFLPFGLGVLLWLKAERPWTEPEPPPTDPKTLKPKRYGGPTGFALTVCAGIVVALLLFLLRALPEWLVPSAL